MCMCLWRRPALERTLADLQLAYLDLFLIHWPHAFRAGPDLFPKNADGTVIYGPRTHACL